MISVHSNLLRWFLLGLVVHASQAAEVVLHLKNGDRITADIVSEDSNQLIVNTPWQKSLIIPLGQIESREMRMDQPLTLLPLTPMDPSASGVEPAGGMLEPAREEAVPTFWQRWKGDIQLGFDLSRSARNRELWYGRTRFTYRNQRFREIVDFQGAYGKTDGLLSANRMDGSSKTDVDLNKRMFLYGLGIASYDEVRRLDYYYEAGPGVGYRIITGTNMAFNAETGFSYTEASFANAPSRNEPDWRLAEDFTWHLNSRIDFEEKIAITPRVDDFSAYRIRMEGTVKFFVLKNMSLNLTMLNLYDTRPAPGVNKNDLQLRSTVGLTF